MAYTLQEGEVAVVLRPVWNRDDSQGEEYWDGDISTHVAFGDVSEEERELSMYLLDIATIISTFYTIVDDYPDIYELVEKKRNEIMGISNEPEVRKSEEHDNVVELRWWSKTEGNA